ncbi:MAG: hypothetical protein OXB86_02935 [Bdellovibrionales bacterium]|nr:hypothetical protein [Bdellovibrionales bacterium]
MTEKLKSIITFDEGRDGLKVLLKEFQEKNSNWNEAETRFNFIDRLLTDCLGWPKSAIRLEQHHDGQFADYLLASPTRVIWEAKKEGAYFELPANISGKTIQSLSSIMEVSSEAAKAIKQVHDYCTKRGVEFAVICNGIQMIAFLAIRIGYPPLKGQALVFQDHEYMGANFSKMWQNLSPEGIAERRLHRLLTTGTNTSVPPKLSSYLLRYPTARYQSDEQTTLQTLAEIIIEDVPETKDIEAKFFQKCYCETGALSRYSLLSKKLLTARYAALFSKDKKQPKIKPASKKDSPLEITEDVITEAAARRPIVLLGDVGVGKTSFIKQLMLLKASNEFQNSINIYIDLGSKAALEKDLKIFIINEINRQLLSKYKVDTSASNFVRGVYNSEVKRFQNSIHGEAYKKDKEKYNESMLKMLAKLLNDKPTHLKRCIEHLAKARKQQVILILDNSDQRPTEMQQAAFIAAQEFASEWNAMVFMSVRPQTFFQSKRSGAFSAYSHRVFTIAPPRPELVIKKRLEFALSVSEGRVSSEKMQKITVNMDNLSLFLKVLLDSIEENKAIREILSNITGGNIRSVIEFIMKFIGSPNINAKKIIEFKKKGEKYIIPIHEFSKAAILGDFSHYNPDSSMAMNLFDVQYPDEKEHFLATMILEFLNCGESSKDKDGFTTTKDIINEMQSWGFVLQQIKGKLRLLTDRKLIENAERITFEEKDSDSFVDSMPFVFRITSLGAYHTKKWVNTFAYLDAMVFDTPILDNSVLKTIQVGLEDFAIAKRIERVKIFRDYLVRTWNTSNLSPAYFDWNDKMIQENENFLKLEKKIASLKFKTQNEES